MRDAARDIYDLDAEAERRQRLAEREQWFQTRFAQNLLWLVQQERGRELVMEILLDSGWRDDGFNPHSGVMSYWAGRRHLACQIQTILDEPKHSELRTLMLTEHRAKMHEAAESNGRNN